MKAHKLLNRIGYEGMSKLSRVEALIYRHLVMVQKRRMKPLTKDQCYRLTTLKNWYKMLDSLEKAKELIEEAKYIATNYGFPIKTEL